MADSMPCRAHKFPNRKRRARFQPRRNAAREESTPESASKKAAAHEPSAAQRLPKEPAPQTLAVEPPKARNRPKKSRLQTPSEPAPKTSKLSNRRSPPPLLSNPTPAVNHDAHDRSVRKRPVPKHCGTHATRNTRPDARTATDCATHSQARLRCHTSPAPK